MKTYLVKMSGHKNVLEGSLKLNPYLVLKGCHTTILNLNISMYFQASIANQRIFKSTSITCSDLICSVIISVGFSLRGGH